MEPILGSVFIFAGTFAPLGCFDCAGQQLAIQDYTALFSLVGTMYGGNGQTTFNLPDLRGRVVIGQGQGGGLPNYVMGQMGGSENVTLNVNQIPSHTHTLTGSFGLKVSTNPGTHQVPAANDYLAAVTEQNGTEFWAYTASAGTTVALGGFSATGATVGMTGGGQPHSNLQPYLVVRYIIAYEGVYPSQP